ncbi:formate dehydrogenase accessory sulfurtransferase FdhD [Herbidospora sp. NBRC 101105]|uniref:formate dehydrogenase accessory sulfurtransferase FdhD n=1 Tax=Herbidospora sp. NBRC 101105 TaxID=3032195 RepID=UPI0024A08A0B|nr:formate dehydrogenase accessory sulfurtransferase FdhD [Herbidospora sp. NBRC 101105]GLX95553.1 sulfurtransferase FdhD [Herbidospora sp. NBRC 101105]
MGDRPVTRYRVRSVAGTFSRDRPDEVATEEPLEIRITSGTERRTLAITMRTPGSDFELAAGFLNGEGITGIEAIAYCTDEDVPPEARFNTVTVRLRGPLPDLPGLDRYFVTSSACGVCGSASLDALHGKCTPLAADDLEISADTLYGLPGKLRAAQGVFGRTGGLHAAGLFTPEGELIRLREDVGRHNAVDKVIGWSLLNDGPRPVLLVSGRASYEIMQKALAAGISIVAAVSAPSSLAVDVAREFGMTLVGFLREERFNVYAGSARVLQTRGDAVDAEQ